MRSMLQMQGTLFLLILLGIYAQRRGIITSGNRKKYTDLIIEIILPCNIVNSFLIDWSYELLRNSITILAVAFLTQIAYVLISKILFRGSERRRQAVLRYAIICSNASFLGNPIAESVFGSQGLLFASIALIPLRFAMWSSGLALFTKTDGKATIRKLVTHPCIVAVFVGFILMLTRFPVPGFVQKTLSGVGSCNTAISMIVIGSILAEIRLKEILEKELFYYSVIRLLIIPLLVLLFLKTMQVDSLVTGVTVLLAAMPAGSTTVMLADKYNGDTKFASSCVFLSTVLSLITIPAISLLLI